MSERPHEAPELKLRYAVIGLVALVACVLLALAVAAGFSQAFNKAGSPTSPGRILTPPAPRLEVDGGAALAGVERRGRQRLTTWGWADRDAGRARIPIDRAMTLTAQCGWREEGVP